MGELMVKFAKLNVCIEHVREKRHLCLYMSTVAYQRPRTDGRWVNSFRGVYQAVVDGIGKYSVGIKCIKAEQKRDIDFNDIQYNGDILDVR